MEKNFKDIQKEKLKQFQIKINNILSQEEREIVNNNKVFANSEKLLDFVCETFVFPEQDIFEEISEILFGYINFEHEFKIFSLDKNEVIKNFDKLLKLISFMKDRLFCNYKNIHPLVYNINDSFENFVNQNYLKYTDYQIKDFHFEIYNYCKQIIKSQLSNNFYVYKENMIFNSAIFNITQFFYMNSVFLEISYLDKLFEEYIDYKKKEDIAGLFEINLKLNFIFRFCNQMINLNQNEAKFYQRSEYMSNFYTNYLTNNWQMFQKEYQNNFMYRVIDQIKIFSCFYFSKLQIVTADTGAGKSTQIPRMLLYYNLCFKIFDGEINNFSSKLACSQPTLRALNTLLSIKNNLEIEEEQKQRKIDVLYYQSIISRKQNLEQIPKQKCLCFYTDGKLLADILSFFIISQEDKIEIKNKISNLIDENYLKEIVQNFIFEIAGLVKVIDKSIDKNAVKQREKIVFKRLEWTPKYNWFIIDEAHKKNQNIELIISFMKFYFKRNNQVNLCIMSATIENDKMNYRNFFGEFSQFRLHMRGVKRLKPNLHIFDFKQQIKSHQMLIKSILLNQIKPMIDKDLQENQQNLFHDILIFQHSKDLVRQLVQDINEYFTDERFIAVPIYSEVPSIISDLIEDKIETLKQFQCPKSQVLEFIYGEKTNKIKTNYKYLIIIGTPIIEESITVKHLRYVIDSGLEQKVLQIQQTEQVYVSFINRNSQVQRQGRICRIPGIPGDYFSLFSQEQIMDVQNLGLLNFNPLPVLFQILNIVKSYFEDFQKIFDEKQIQDILYNENSFYDFICQNLISKLQPFNFNQIFQNYIIPFESCDKNYSNINYIQLILKKFLKNQLPVFDQLQILFQPYYFQIQPNLLKKQHQIAVQRDKLNKILIYMSYFIINSDFPPFFMNSPEEDMKGKQQNSLQNKQQNKQQQGIQGNYLEQINKFKEIYLEIEKKEFVIQKFIEKNKEKIQQLNSNIQIYLSMKQGEEMDKFKDLVQFFNFLPAKKEFQRLQKQDDFLSWRNLFQEFCSQTIYGISQFYLISFPENSIKQIYFKYNIQDSCLHFQSFEGFELNNFQYQLYFPQIFQKNKFLFIQFFKLNLKIDHQLKQLKPQFIFFNVIKSFDKFEEFKNIKI